jgi:hypothetical protein
MGWTLKFTLPGEQAWYWKQWGYKYSNDDASARSSTTKPSVSGMALLAQALTLYAQAIPVGDQEPTATQRTMMEQADKLFEAIINSKEESLVSSRCTALYRRGELLNRLRKNQEAAALFARVAREYKDNPLAGKAALNVVMIWSGVIAELNSSGKEIVPKMRQELVEAIDVLLGNPQWAKEDWAKPSPTFSARGWRTWTLPTPAAGSRERSNLMSRSRRLRRK